MPEVVLWEPISAGKSQEESQGMGGDSVRFGEAPFGTLGGISFLDTASCRQVGILAWH